MAADRRGNDAADADAIYDAVRRSQRVDPDSAANREPADKNCLKRPVLLAIQRVFCYLIFMALRPEDLPKDPALLTELVLAFDGEIESLRATVATLRKLIFGVRSERSAVIGAEQSALDLLDDASAAPRAANDDDERPSPAKPRRKAKRNIGALPKHLPRCEQVIEPETTTAPLFWRLLASG